MTFWALFDKDSDSGIDDEAEDDVDTVDLYNGVKQLMLNIIITAILLHFTVIKKFFLTIEILYDTKFITHKFYTT